MPKWNPSTVKVINASKEDRQKIVSELAWIVYALALAKDRQSNPSPTQEPSKPQELGDAA